MADTQDSQQGKTTLVRTALKNNQYGPERQAVLDPDDQAAVNQYEAAQQAQIDKCQEALDKKKAKAQQAIDDLNEKIATDEENIANDADDKKAVAADKKKLTAHQKALTAANLDLSKAMNAECPPPKKIYCVPVKKSSIKPSLTLDEWEVLNGKGPNKTAIDFSILSKKEGATFAEAYIPWWPDVDKNPNGNPVASVDGKKGYVVGYNNGKRNSSGSTLGQGIDLGGQDKDAYFKNLSATNKTLSNPLSDAEFQQLKNKLDPYMGLKRSQACLFLQAHPLSLEDPENPEFAEKALELLNKNGANTALRDAIKNYNDISQKVSFKDLSSEQQTKLFYDVYNGGTQKGSSFWHDAETYSAEQIQAKQQSAEH